MTETVQTILWGYLVLINLVTFAFYGMDKYKAKKGKWRIPEKTLLGLAVIGGSVGALCGTNYFHHKTKKLKFSVGVPAILAVHLAVCFAAQFCHIL